MEWSSYQQAIFDHVGSILDGDRDLVILARAGTGKTTTMIEAIIRFCAENEGDSVLMCAFNKRNADELGEKLAAADLDWRTAQAKTLNGVGYSACKRKFPDIDVDPRKGRDIARKQVEMWLDKQPDIVQRTVKINDVAPAVQRVASIAKITLTDPEEFKFMRSILLRYFGSIDTCSDEDVVRMAKTAMEIAAEQTDYVDFDDQLWFPHIFNLWPWRQDLVIVDEAQDMNASQLALARKSVKKYGRLIAIGDDKQAIYGWRGADSEFMLRMIQHLNAETLSLPRTYRCGKVIVGLVKELVPDFEADESNSDGIIRNCFYDEMVDECGPGDFVLSRTNAPLLGLCFQLLAEKKPVIIQGRDICERLVGMLERSKTETRVELLAWLSRYHIKEAAKLEEEDAEELLAQLSDQCACMRVLAQNRETVPEMIVDLRKMFGDDPSADAVVTLSTVHRAKGLERDRVWILEDTFKRGGDQEDNVKYVAYTRAKNELVFVMGD